MTNAPAEEDELLGGEKKAVANTAAPAQPGVMYFLRQRTILVNLIAMTVVWMTVAFNYFMINLQVKYFPGVFEINMIVMFSTDIPASLFAGYLITVLRAKVVFMTFFALQAVAGLCILLFTNAQDPGVAFPLLIAAARVGVAGAFTAVWAIHPKMFPTLFAVTSIGISNIVSRSIVTLAPMAAELAYPTPIIIFTILNIGAFFSST